MSLLDIAAQLEEPFPIEDIELLPKGSMEREGKTLCMALPYADPRVYQDRLNKLAPGEWQTPAPLALVVGNKLVCYVTIVIYGVSHTDVGEAGPGDNQGTEAFAQAFKRAASQFGLGRYLYNLEKAWVPYNVKGKRIDLDAAGIQKVVKQMYQKAGISLSNAPRSLQNGHQVAQLAYGDIYREGAHRGMWTRETFYATASGILDGFPVSVNNVRDLSQEQLQKLQRDVERYQAEVAS